MAKRPRQPAPTSPPLPPPNRLWEPWTLAASIHSVPRSAGFPRCSGPMASPYRSTRRALLPAVVLPRVLRLAVLGLVAAQ